MTVTKIAIVLSTYNGEKFLAEQLDSLIDQSYKNLIIVARDDGSSDGTLKIIRDYQSKFPDLFHVIDDDGRNLGAIKSYSLLIDYVLAHKKQLGLNKAYIMLCDQDDIWIVEKAAIEMQSMIEAEACFTTETPILVHSDMQVISDSRELIADSFIKYQGLDINRGKFSQILLSNIVTGCTVLLNECLARKSIPISQVSIMHDWWLALVASAFGKLVLINQPLVGYRQHDSNTIGAKEFKYTNHTFLEKLEKVFKSKPDPLLVDLAVQAKAFLKQYRTQLDFGNKLRLFVLSTLKIRSIALQNILIQIAYKL